MKKLDIKTCITIIVMIIAFCTGVSIINDVNNTKSACNIEANAKIIGFKSNYKSIYAVLDVEGTQIDFAYAKGKAGDTINVMTNNERTKLMNTRAYWDQIGFGILLIVLSCISVVVTLVDIIKHN